jgi:hypothetical protein
MQFKKLLFKLIDLGSNHVVVSASQKISDYNLVLESL